MREVWKQLNHRLLKWVKWKKGMDKMAAVRWLKQQYKTTPAFLSIGNWFSLRYIQYRAIYKHEEPCEVRVLCTVLWEGAGEIPFPYPIVLNLKETQYSDDTNRPNGNTSMG